MKKWLLLSFVFFSIVVNAQYIDYNKITWSGVCDNKNVSYDRFYGITIQDSIVSISVKPITDRNDWDINIKNISKSKIIIKWEAATIGDSYSSTRVLFGTMKMYQINDPMQPSVIYQGSSLDKNIIGQQYAENEFYNLVSKKEMKKWFKKYKRPEKRTVVLIVPIEYNDKEYIYKLQYTATYSG